MSKFEAFMAGNAAIEKNKKVIISKRFKNASGKPIAWEIKSLTAEENETIQRKCMVNAAIPGQKNQYNRELDQIKYTNALLTAMVVYPALNDAELQNSYGVMGAENLLKKMLYLDEYNQLAKACTSFNDDKGIVNLVDDAKNS